MKKIIGALVATTLGGCGTYLPNLTSHEVLPLDVLLARIDCEFEWAVWRQKITKGRAFLKGWQGVYTVTLKSNETGSAKALSNTFPLVPSKNLAVNVNAGAGVTTTANRTALMKFSLAFDRVAKEPVCFQAQTNSLHPFVTGYIGFEEWMNRALDAAEFGGKMQMGEPQRVSSLGHSFEFIIVANANAGAGFIIGPAPTVSLNPAAAIERVDDGVVDVVIAKPAVDPVLEALVALTKEEKELIELLKRSIEKNQAGIDSRMAVLNERDNKALVAKFVGQSKMTIQSVRPSDAGQQRDTGLTKEELEKVQALAGLEEENRKAEQQNEKNLLTIAEVKRPKVVTRPRILPPERNPEITYTNQQLTLERLNNNLRLVVP